MILESDGCEMKDFQIKAVLVSRCACLTVALLQPTHDVFLGPIL